MSGGEGTHGPDRTSQRPVRLTFCLDRGVEGHWSHPHGRNWKDIANCVHPDLAELVGLWMVLSALFLEPHIYISRGSRLRSRMYGYVDRQSTFNDVGILQAKQNTLQDPL